jgi:hypothetical protein
MVVITPSCFAFDPRSGHVGFVVDEVVLGQVFSKYFGFPCQFDVIFDKRITWRLHIEMIEAKTFRTFI